MTEPTVTVLVVTHLGGEVVARCVDSLRDQLGARDHIVLVVSAPRAGPVPEGEGIEVVAS